MSTSIRCSTNLSVTQIPKPAYAIAIATTSQAALQTTIARHGIVPNNPDPVPTSVNFSFQQLIATTANIPPTIDAQAFADLVGILSSSWIGIFG